MADNQFKIYTYPLPFPNRKRRTQYIGKGPRTVLKGWRGGGGGHEDLGGGGMMLDVHKGVTQ